MTKLFKLIAIQRPLSIYESLAETIAGGYECPITFEEITSTSTVVAIPNRNGSYYFVSQKGYDAIKNNETGSVQHPLDRAVTVAWKDMRLIKPKAGLSPENELIAEMKIKGRCLITDTAFDETDCEAVVALPRIPISAGFDFIDISVLEKMWAGQKNGMFKNPFNNAEIDLEEMTFMKKNQNGEWNVFEGKRDSRARFILRTNTKYYRLDTGKIVVLDLNSRSQVVLREKSRIEMTCHMNGDLRSFYKLTMTTGAVPQEYICNKTTEGTFVKRYLEDGSTFRTYIKGETPFAADGTLNAMYGIRTYPNGTQISGSVVDVYGNGDFQFYGSVTQKTQLPNRKMLQHTYVQAIARNGRAYKTRNDIHIKSNGLSYTVKHNGREFDFSKAQLTGSADGSVVIGQLYNLHDGSMGFLNSETVTRVWPNYGTKISGKWNVRTLNVDIPINNWRQVNRLLLGHDPRGPIRAY